MIAANRSCPELSANCSYCHENINCVWCDTEQTCLTGDPEAPFSGPVAGFCPKFDYETCTTIEPLLLAIIAYVFFIGFLLANLITAVLDDCAYKSMATLDADTTRSSFWRSVRSAFGYLSIEKFQYVAVVLVTNVPKSTILLQFSLYFSWLVGGTIPFFQ